jgi:hypothetical protein
VLDSTLDEFESRINSLTVIGRNPDELSSESQSLLVDFVEESIDIAIDKKFSFNFLLPMIQTTDLSIKHNQRRIPKPSSLRRILETSDSFSNENEDDLMPISSLRKLGDKTAVLGMSDSFAGQISPPNIITDSLVLAAMTLDVDSVESRDSSIISLPQTHIEISNGDSPMLVAFDGTTEGSSLSLGVLRMKSSLYPSKLSSLFSGDPLRFLASENSSPLDCSSKQRFVNISLSNKQQFFDSQIAPVTRTIICPRTFAPQNITVNCSDTASYVLQCNGTLARVQVQCPFLILKPSCAEIFDDSSFSNDSCHPVSFNSDSTICQCDMCGTDSTRRMLSSSNSRFVSAVEVVALTDMVFGDLAMNVIDISEFDSIEDFLEASTVFAYFSFIWLFGLGFALVGTISRDFSGDHIAKNRIKPGFNDRDYDTKMSSDVSVNAKNTPPISDKLYNGGDTKDKTDQGSIDRDALHNMYKYIGNLFPGGFSNHARIKRLGWELSQHEFLLAIFSAKKMSIRFSSALFLITSASLSAFLVAILFTIQYPTDDGECRNYFTEPECLFRTSVFNSQESKCVWTRLVVEGSDYNEISFCEWQDPQLTIFTSFFVVSFPLPGSHFLSTL